MRLTGLRVLCCIAGPSFPSKSFAKPCNVFHELPQRFAIGLSFLLPWLPLELVGLLNLSRGIGLPPRLSNGLGSGLAALLVGAVLGFSSWLLSSSLSPTSLKPEINRRLRGRREDEVAGVELVRTSLACIAGDTDYASTVEAAALIAWFLWVLAEADCCCLSCGAAGHGFVGSASAGAVVVSYSISGIGQSLM